MIFTDGKLLPDPERRAVLDGLGPRLDAIRTAPPLRAETVIGAVDALGKRLEAEGPGSLLSRALPAGMTLGELLPLLRREALEAKLSTELGPDPFAPRSFSQTTAHVLPLGVLFHIAPGNMPGLPVYTVLEGLLTGNINLLKLPHGDKGLSLMAFKLLVEQEPLLAPYIHAFDLPSGQTGDMKILADLADGLVTWGGDGAIQAARTLAGPGCKLVEWGHRLSFAYISGYEDEPAELSALAAHIAATGQRLCSSCQTIFLDTEDREVGTAFCRKFLPYLEAAAAGSPGPGAGAMASLSGHTALLERIVDGRAQGEALFRGKGCGLILRPDHELELSPMERNVLVKLLPQKDLLPTLRRQKGRLQTAGLLCTPEKRDELTELLARAGLTRITRAGTMSAAFPGEAHDGEYPLRRYLRIVDVERA